MPIYAYACAKCEHTFDALQKMSDDPLVDCPDCGEPALKKLLSAPKFRLKGQGWYETDFKKDNQRNLSTSDGAGGKSDGKSKDTSKSESKGEKSVETGGSGKKASKASSSDA